MQRESPAGRREVVALPTRPGDEGANLSRPEVTMTPSPPPSVPATARLFHLLGDPTRLRVLLLIREKGEASPADLAAAAGMSRQATTYHLTLLRRGGVAGSRRAGHQVFYRITSRLVAGLLREVGEG
jgi:ArsR family transcriptional regulator, lead/cadmium/zinc/bismuth-responsive transcriptional repressor